MISFHSNKRLETAFKNVVLCENKSEREIVGQGVLELFGEFEHLADKLQYIAKKINEDIANAIVYAMYLYPEMNLEKAVNAMYEDIKTVNEAFNDVDEEHILKYIKTSKDIENNINKLGKKYLAKVYYLKEVIKAAKECVFS